MKTSSILSTAFIVFLSLLPQLADAQLPRERAVTNPPVDEIFWTTTNIGISTVYNISPRNLNTSVAHIFGLINGGIEHFYGLDDGANTRLGLDYGLTDRFSMGIGRMTFNKVVDIRGKYNILRQTTTGSTPIELGVKGSLGISTLSGIGMELTDRLSYFTMLMLARKFDRLSVQLSPMMAYYNFVTEGKQNRLIGMGILTNYEISDRLALSAEYLPIIGNRNQGTSDEMAIALNINTGGHVFQIFFSSSQWHNEQFIMANNHDRFWEGEVRFGFNINRVFGF